MKKETAEHAQNTCASKGLEKVYVSSDDHVFVHFSAAENHSNRNNLKITTVSASGEVVVESDKPKKESKKKKKSKKSNSTATSTEKTGKTLSQMTTAELDSEAKKREGLDLKECKNNNDRRAAIIEFDKRTKDIPPAKTESTEEKPSGTSGAGGGE